MLLLTLAGVTVLNAAFILYLLNTLKGLLPAEHQYSKSLPLHISLRYNL